MGGLRADRVGEAFNLTNGEVFDWRSVWPAFADALGLELAPDAPMRLGDFLPASRDVWRQIVERHGIRPISIDELLGQSHHYADICFNTGKERARPPVLVSTVKIKQAGFCEVYDTEASFRHWFNVLVRRRILPPA